MGKEGESGADTMASEQHLASQAASLRAGVAATVMIVIVCFGVAIAFSDSAAIDDVAADASSPSAGPEVLQTAR